MPGQGAKKDEGGKGEDGSTRGTTGELYVLGGEREVLLHSLRRWEN